MTFRSANIRKHRVSDAVVQSRSDRRTIAQLAMFFSEQGDPPGSIANLVRMALEELREILEEHKLCPEIESSEDATHILMKHGLEQINPSGRGSENYFKRLSLESRMLSGNTEEPLLITKRLIDTTDDKLLKEAKRLMATGTIKREIEAKKDESEALSTTEPLSDEAKDRIMKAQGKDNSEKSALMQIPPLANATNEP